MFSESRVWVWPQPHPLLVHLRDGRRRKDRAWIRKQEAQIAGREIPKLNSQLTKPENELVVQSRAITASVPENMRPDGSNATADLAYGFGMTSMSIKRADTRVLSRNNDATRKRRSDVSENVFNSNKKQRAVFTALHYYKKWR
eukprot:scaffold306184_cov27-Attheya_sp.AAC.2